MGLIETHSIMGKSHVFAVIKLSVIMVSIIILSVIMLNVTMLIVTILIDLQHKGPMHSFIALSVIMLKCHHNEVAQ